MFAEIRSITYSEMHVSSVTVSTIREMDWLYSRPVIPIIHTDSVSIETQSRVIVNHIIEDRLGLSRDDDDDMRSRSKPS